jgi:hypothetical protein
MWAAASDNKTLPGREVPQLLPPGGKNRPQARALIARAACELCHARMSVH